MKAFPEFLVMATAMVACVTAAIAAPEGNGDGTGAASEIPLATGIVANMPPETSFAAPGGKRAYRNVSRATITPVLPKIGIATGAAVLILPGGAFAMLSMDTEGWPIAHWFADRGVAAFVVKYRLNPTPAGQAAFDADMIKQYQAIVGGGEMPDLAVPPQALEDGNAALRFVHDHAKDYGVDPERIGMIGFSAGAMTTLAVVASGSPDLQPAFIAPIYPPMKPVSVPVSAPPMFVAIAADDPLFGKQGFGLVQAWQSAHKAVELHFYQRGGHGFGEGEPTHTVSDWKLSLLHWMQMNGFLSSADQSSQAAYPASSIPE